MTHMQHRFHTNGSNALKVDEAAFDIFVKPQFPSDPAAPIIDFEDARSGFRTPKHPVSDDYFTIEKSLPQPPLAWRILTKIEHDRLLGDLFKTQKRNKYRRSDLGLFAKGFTLTGLATFIMILFGA